MTSNGREAPDCSEASRREVGANPEHSWDHSEANPSAIRTLSSEEVGPMNVHPPGHQHKQNFEQAVPPPRSKSC